MRLLKECLGFLSLELMDRYSGVFQTHGWDARGSCGDIDTTNKAVCGVKILRCGNSQGLRGTGHLIFALEGFHSLF